MGISLPTSSRLRVVFQLFLGLQLQGCLMGPDYIRPEIEPAINWRLSTDEARETANISWWQLFGDEQLDTLIQSALLQNLDLKVAVASVEEYYARLGIARSSLFPQLNASISGARARSSTALSQSDFQGFEARSSEIRAGLDLSWEIDLWGRIRRSTEAAGALLMNREEARRGVVLQVVSATARAYIQLRSLDKKLDIALRTRKTREDSLALIQSRFNAGVTAELDVRRAEAELEFAKGVIPQLEIQIAQTENLLSVLLGGHSRSINRGLAIDSMIKPFKVPEYLPSQVLEQRPDILAAEYQLRAANAGIGQAKAEYFPRISLTGIFGYASEDLSDLFKGTARTWSYGPLASLPLFSAGRIGSQVEAAEAAKEQAINAYRRSIISAFQEVENALISHRKTFEQTEAQVRQVKALARYYELARVRYDAGQSDYLEVLDAQRPLFEAELALADLQAQYLYSFIDLYRSMGGGWITEADDQLMESLNK